MKKVIVSLLIIVTLLSLSACVNRAEKYTSPSGNKKITVEYDFVRIINRLDIPVLLFEWENRDYE